MAGIKTRVALWSLSLAISRLTVNLSFVMIRLPHLVYFGFEGTGN